MLVYVLSASGYIICLNVYLLLAPPTINSYFVAPPHHLLRP